jgi:DNA/RNA endonuclease YhcR with UshA esterase domain
MEKNLGMSNGEKNMKHRHWIAAVILLLTSISACTDTGQRTPPPTPTTVVETLEPTVVERAAARVVFSEVLAGVDGNNNFDFIELHNAGDFAADLDGHTLWYQLSDEKEEILLFEWVSTTLIPPRGHYLLALAGEDVGIPVDAVFNQPIVPSRGGLRLLTPDGEIVDILGWGNAPQAFVEGNPAQAHENNFSIERLPGGSNGNSIDTDENSTDYILNESPNPQNTGSTVTPIIDDLLQITGVGPESAEPGSDIVYSVSITNPTDEMAENVQVEFPVSKELGIVQAERFNMVGESAFWQVGNLAAGETLNTEIILSAPLTFTTIVTHSYSIFADNFPVRSFGGPIQTVIEGGSIPIQVAKGLLGEEVIVEGISTMYTGAFYAGSGNHKFYIQDETGGVMAYVPGAEGKLDVPIGARVRIRGTIEIYRGAFEIIPAQPDHVEILELQADDSSIQPIQLSIEQAIKEKGNLAGLLALVEGTVARVEEFAFSFELDMIDEQGQLLTLYIDKGTNISVETVESGHRYRITGIFEIYDKSMDLYPRQQSDLVEVFPPVLLIEANSSNTVEQEGLFTVTITVSNHTPNPLTNLRITASLPSKGARFENILNDGFVSDNMFVWDIPAMGGNGESLSVQYQARATGENDFLSIQGYQVTAEEWENPVTGAPTYTFIGSRVPIWAIQGTGFRSSYLLEEVRTAGVVTGVFPGLGGFFIQEVTSDDDPLSSSGLFINSGELDVDVQEGNYIEVFGVIREAFQQTQLVVEKLEDIQTIRIFYTPPTPIELDPPANETEAAIYYEALEGTLVKVTGPAVAVAPTNRYAEYTLVLPSHERDRLFQGEQNGMAISVDDASSEIHSDQSTLDYVVSAGDQVSNLVGPLGFTYGNYKIMPLKEPRVVSHTTEFPKLQPTGSNEFSLMTWNVENLFDIKDPHPTNQLRPKLSEYKRDIAKVANTIIAAGAPTIVGLQEVENIEILEDITEHDSLKEYNYQPVLIEGTDSRGIDVCYLVRGDSARILDIQQLVAPEGLTSRPPLFIEVEIYTDSGPIVIYVVNNHFTSMSGGETATEPRRNAQAAWNVSILDNLLSSNPEAYFAVIGDLNSYYQSLPITTLKDASLKHVFDLLPAEERYTYIYMGVSQTLDHILTTVYLYNLIERVEVLHVNADYPPPIMDDESPQRKSDHDPLIVTFSLSD